MKLCAPTLSPALVVILIACAGASASHRSSPERIGAEVRATMQRLRADPAQPDPCRPPPVPTIALELGVGSVELGEIAASGALGEWYFNGTQCYQPTPKLRGVCWNRCYRWPSRAHCDAVRQLCAEHAR